MNFSFFNRLVVKKVVVPTAGEAGRQAEKMITDIWQELPDMLLGYIVDCQTSNVLAFYTVSNAYNPNQLSLRNTKLLRTMQEALATKAWPGGPLTDVSVILEDQLHHLRPLKGGDWYCFVAVRLADANLGIIKDVVRRHTA
jgi:hypothetical protein